MIDRVIVVTVRARAGAEDDYAAGPGRPSMDTY